MPRKIFRRFGQGLVLASTVFAVAQSSAAETISARFNGSVAGIRAGTVELRGTESGGRYEIQGAATSSGLVGQFVRFTVRAASAGRVEQRRYRPSSYNEISESRDGTRRITYRYRAGIPQVTQSPPADDRKAHYVGPEGQQGTLDPLTGLWSLLRDQPRDAACSVDFSSYNGETRSRLRLIGFESGNGGLTCRGEYRREAGFSEKEMAEQISWPFTLTYEDTGSPLLRVTQLRVPTSFGVFVLTRQ